MKKFGYLVIACVCAAALALVGCGNNGAASSSATADSESSTKEAPAIDGGWEYQPLDEVHLDADAQKIFDNAAKGADAQKYTPVAVLATQVVAGMNYAFLCETDANTWHIVAVYNDLQDKASIISDEEIDVANVKVAETDQPGGDENLVGAWEVVMPEGPAVISETSWIAFDDAMEGSAGLDLVPQATLGSQVVAGTNYRYLCAGQPVVQDPSTSLYIVDVYSDLDGKSQISDVKYFDLLSYIDQ